MTVTSISIHCSSHLTASTAATELNPHCCRCSAPRSFTTTGCPPHQGLTLVPCALSIHAGDGSVSSLGHKPDLPLHSPSTAHLNEPRSERTHLQSLLQESCTTIRSIGKFIREAPVTNKEYKRLENRNRNTTGSVPYSTH